jgi:hypothetical protein
MKQDKAILSELRHYLAKRTFCDNSVVCYEFTVGDRQIDLQLWNDGNHRVSHFLRGRMSTVPTDFKTVEEMKAAIQRELTRTDHSAPPVGTSKKPLLVLGGAR